MKRCQKGKGQKRPKKKTEPLAEGIVPLDKRGRRSWKSISDDELISYARQVMEEKGIGERYELFQTDSGLYGALRKRGLLDRAGFEELRRDWASMSDDEVVGHAQRVVENKGVKIREDLNKVDSGLYNVLQRRKLFDKVGLAITKRDWASMSDDEVVGHAQEFMRGKGISGRKELQKADSGLYRALWKRGLLERIGFEEKRRDWNSMGDEELVEYTRGFVSRNSINERKELERADGSLYQTVRRRGLLDDAGFEKKAETRDWASMSDEEIVGHAQGQLRERGWAMRSELEEADSGLYQALRRRRLLDRVIPGSANARRRKWISMSDDEVVEYALGFIENKGITRRIDLHKADSGLYNVLRKRKLLERVGLQKQRQGWASMDDDEFIGYAQRFLQERGISKRIELSDADSGLYSALYRRGLMDRVFAPLESQDKREAVQQVVDAMKEFDA